MEPVRNAGKGFFPLDEEVDLTGSELTPQAQEGLVRLASWMPFGEATRLLEALVGVQVSKTSVRRLTLQAREAGVQEWEDQTAALQPELPPASAGASQQVMSADGAMVPLVGGEWAEVKTLVVGEVTVNEAGKARVEHLSYCSRLADVAGFEQATLLETHRRGVEQARQVAAVTDGAQWRQGFIDYQRADAVRILDFAHAAEYVHALGEAVREAGHRLPAGWLDGVLHRLKHDGPERVLLHLARRARRCPTPEVRATWQYLLQRHSQMQYPLFQAAGWPIGSGMVESANKLVVEARLKGAGMQWKRENVNPLLALRNAVCNDRWNETWQGRMKQASQHRKQERERHRQVRLEQAIQRLMRLLLPLVLCKPHRNAPVPSPVSSSSGPVAPLLLPKGGQRHSIVGGGDLFLRVGLSFKGGSQNFEPHPPWVPGPSLLLSLALCVILNPGARISLSMIRKERMHS